MTKRKVPNVVRGGKAIPLKGKTNYYYMQGRKHSSGGIDIGENPRTGLEVEDGEVMHVADKEIKVFSSVPFLNGESPAQKVMGGENPTKVFNQQEEFKDKHNMNDDGTKKKKRMGGLSRKKIMGQSLNLILKLRQETLLVVEEVILFLLKLMLLMHLDLQDYMDVVMLKLKFIVNILNFVKSLKLVDFIQLQSVVELS